MTRLPAGAMTDAAALPLEHEPVPPDQTLAGRPTTAFATLDAGEQGELGVWEMSPGTMSDVEADELFVVLAGDATVEFIDPELPSIELAPGAVVRLTAGMRTVWTVRQTLRKVYVAQ